MIHKFLQVLCINVDRRVLFAATTVIMEVERPEPPTQLARSTARGRPTLHCNPPPPIASDVNMSAMDMAAVSLQCDFYNLEHCKDIECGVYPSYPRESNTVHLRQCTKNIRSHLQKWKVAAHDVNVEWKLILLRCGLFDVDAYNSDKTICPAHRYKLGLSWTSTRKCCHPLHEGKGKPCRGANKTTSREVG